MFETTRAVASLILNGTLKRCPRVRIILPYAGGTVPFISLRLSMRQFWPGLQEHVPWGVVAYPQRLYYDTALSAAPFALRSLQEFVDDSYILFGSDYPFAPELAAATFSGLNEYPGFDEAAREAVFRRNAEGLFPRLRARA